MSRTDPPTAATGRGRKPPAVTQGAVLDIEYMRLRPKSYPVMESQFDTLAVYSGWTNFFSSVGSALVTLGISNWANAVSQERLSDLGGALLNVGTPVVLLGGVGCWSVAAVFFLLRRSDVARIKRQAERDTAAYYGRPLPSKKGVWPTIVEWWQGPKPTAPQTLTSGPTT